MVYISILILITIAYFYTQKDKKKIDFKENQTIAPSPQKKEFFSSENLNFTEKLNKTKELYPFSYWHEELFKESEMEVYTKDNCNAAKSIFDNLIDKLSSIGEEGTEEDKIALFKKAILDLNDLNNKLEGLIETGEREDLCELIDQITIASGLNPYDYADEGGLADFWREW